MSAAPVLYLNHVSAVSGAEKSLLALLSKLDRNAFTPILACPPGKLAIQAEELGIETLSLPLARFARTANPLKKSLYALAWFAGTNHLRKIIASTAPALIHSNSATAHLYAASLAKKAGIPCAWHARDLRPLPFPAPMLCRKTDRIIAVSDAVSDLLAATGFSRPRITRIYNGIDPAAWQAQVTQRDVRSALGIPAEGRVILLVAQFVPWKRHEDAIRALPRILEEEPAARLVLVGSDQFERHTELVGELKGLAQGLRIQDKVIFAGQRDDVADLMAAAELVVVPSDAEPFGLVALEAMSLGKPVVGTRAGGLPEVVRDGETGLLVVPRFPESLAASCVRLLKNESLARSLGEAGRARVDKLFHINRTAQEIQMLYEAILHPPLKWVGV